MTLMFGPESESDREMIRSMSRALLLVLLPGMVVVMLIIALGIAAGPPRSPPVPVYGCYQSSGTPMVRITRDAISIDHSGLGSIPMKIENIRGPAIVSDTGFSFHRNRSGGIVAIKDFPKGEISDIRYDDSGRPSIEVLDDEETMRLPKVACPAPIPRHG